jgi:holliday junction DNA helicase RuvB
VALEINDAAPTSLSHLVGQKQVIDQVTTALDAAFQDAAPFPHTLLVGGPGLGKSQLASVIAQEMASDFHEVLGQAITSVADLNALLLATKDGGRDVIFIDEAHELQRPFQTALYLALDKGVVFAKSRGAPQGLRIAKFTLLLGTSEEYSVLQPLRDRCRLICRFDFFSNDELVELLRRRCKALGWEIDAAVLPLIAQRSRGIPRWSLRLLQASRRVCRAEGEQSITQVHFNRACILEGIDELGLGPAERKYLAILLEGPNRLNVIASILGLPTRTVSQVIESSGFLIRAGLVSKDKNGLRELTAKGREHLQRTSNG